MQKVVLDQNQIKNISYKFRKLLNEAGEKGVTKESVLEIVNNVLKPSQLYTTLEAIAGSGRGQIVFGSVHDNISGRYYSRKFNPNKKREERTKKKIQPRPKKVEEKSKTPTIIEDPNGVQITVMTGLTTMKVDATKIIIYSK